MMKQLALDIGLPRAPSLEKDHPGRNEAAWQHLRAWVNSPVLSPVPTYLWGPPGSGKSHLLEAVRHGLAEHGATTGWLDPSMLHPPDYDEGWACVLLDDVSRYNGVQQQAAFSWFVQAQILQRGVLAAGDQAPVHLTQLREDLRTRLGWGHVFSLQAPREPEMRAMLRQAADARGIFLGDEVMDFILNRFSRDPASLLALLDQLDTYALQAQRAITIPLVKAMLEDL